MEQIVYGGGGQGHFIKIILICSNFILRITILTKNPINKSQPVTLLKVVTELDLNDLMQNVYLITYFHVNFLFQVVPKLVEKFKELNQKK